MNCERSVMLFAFAIIAEQMLSEGNKLIKSSQDLSSTGVVVVGSLNVDIIIEVERLPLRDETVQSRNPRTTLAVGGKGANQAVAAARLVLNSQPNSVEQYSAPNVKFVCQFGNDAYVSMLESVLRDNSVDISSAEHTDDFPSGQGIVFLEADGAVSSIVVGGANVGGWSAKLGADAYVDVLRGAGVVMLQREVPEYVNEALAEAAFLAGVPVFQDAGGEDRPISENLLKHITVLSPNESELHRMTQLPTTTDDDVVAAARSLQARGARSVLVTLGSRGAVLLGEDGQLTWQPSLPVPGGVIVDATGAGDSFRAAFVVAMVEGRSLQDCMRFAAASGAVTVSKMGAVPSLPYRQQVESLLAAHSLPLDPGSSMQGGDRVHGECGDESLDVLASGVPAQHAPQARAANISKMSTSLAHLRFGARLNSMRSRLDLWHGKTTDSVLGLIARQGTVRGLDVVDLNFPQHFEGMSARGLRSALRNARLAAAAVNVRFPSTMRLGAFTNPEAGVRTQAVKMTVEACHWARVVGAREVVVWPQYDGYDYHFQMDYPQTWTRAVHAYQEVCDACAPDILVSLEYKPTDQSSRFALVPSTGSALMFVAEVDRDNMGLTLDLGHMLAAGENPGQGVAMVGAAGKLFGIHLNDGHSRLGAEDGLAFGSVHPTMGLEVVWWLQKTNYSGHLYFDTFPINEDPVRETEFNIRRFKSMWDKVARLGSKLEGFLTVHDAIGAMEVLFEQEYDD